METFIEFETEGLEEVLVVAYEYTPETPQTLDYPGDNEHVEIYSVKLNGLEIIDIVSNDILDKMELQALETERGDI